MTPKGLSIVKASWPWELQSRKSRLLEENTRFKFCVPRVIMKWVIPAHYEICGSAPPETAFPAKFISFEVYLFLWLSLWSCHSGQQNQTFGDPSLPPHSFPDSFSPSLILIRFSLSLFFFPQKQLKFQKPVVPRQIFFNLESLKSNSKERSSFPAKFRELEEMEGIRELVHIKLRGKYMLNCSWSSV